MGDDRGLRRPDPGGHRPDLHYLLFLLGIALVWSVRPAVARPLLALSVVTQWILLAPLPFMPRWPDDQFAAISVATVAGLLWALWRSTSAPEAPAHADPDGIGAGQRLEAEAAELREGAGVEVGRPAAVGVDGVAVDGAGPVLLGEVDGRR